MTRPYQGTISLREDRIRSVAGQVRDGIGSLVLVNYLLVLAAPWWPGLLPIQRSWLEWGFLVLAVTASLTELARGLPAQNVVLATATILVITGLSLVLARLVGAVLGDHWAVQVIAPARLPPAILFLSWMVMVFTARGTAQILLRNWQKRANYGFWLLGASLGLMLIQLYSGAAYGNVSEVLNWSNAAVWWSAPRLGQLAWSVPTAGLLLVAITPALIQKKPDLAARDSPSSGRLAGLWFLTNTVLVSAFARLQLWNVVLLVTVGTLVVGVGCVRAERQER